MRHWVFDLDGTLVDSFAHYFAALETIFAEHGKTFSPDLRRAALTEPLDSFFAGHLGSEALAPAFVRLRAMSNDDAQRIRAFAGLEPTLEALIARGSRVAIWTNRDLESASLIVRHSGLWRLSESCVSGTCVTRRKPDPEGLLRLSERFGCRPDEITMVGDHEHDVVAAKSIGARAVRASWHSYWPEAECSIADRQFTAVTDFSLWALDATTAS